MRKLLFILFLVFGLFLLVSCNFGGQNTNYEDHSDDRYKIFLLAEQSGYTGSYEDWLKSISGKEIELTVSSDNILMWKYTDESVEKYRKLLDLSVLKGKDGDKGEKGNDGISVSLVYIDDKGDLIVKLSDGSMQNAGHLTHKYEMKYDEEYHWQQCKGCGDVIDKEEHDLTKMTINDKYLYNCNHCDYEYVVEPRTLTLQVSEQSKPFYEQAVRQYIKNNDVDFKIKVVGADTGAAADTFLKDPEAGADIFTIAHDNIGKLIAGSGVISPITTKALVSQMESQNHEAFLDVCYLNSNYYAVPYISQSLVYYYNKSLISASKVTSWESILKVAKQKGKLAVAWTGTDGYNFSSWLLAEPYNEAAKAVFGSKGTLKLYQNGNMANCDVTGDDMIAIMKYAQRFINDPNGRNGLASDNYVTEIQNDKVLGFISGSWKYNEAVSAWGKENVGVASLPTFTLTEADAYGKAVAGMEFKSGSFVDCKCFVKKKDTKFKDEELDHLIMYLTSDAIQKQAYIQVDNLPASKTVDLGSSADQLALAQLQMLNWGIPQPFGYQDYLNPAYYSKGTSDRFVSLIENKNGKYTVDKILVELQTITYVWTHLASPKDVASLNAWLTSPNCICSNKTPAAALNK